MARKGSIHPEDVPKRNVSISEIEIINNQLPVEPEVILRIHCGKGTYIRSLAHDLGQALGVGGYLVDLRRTAIGEYSVEDAMMPKEATEANIIPL